MHLDAELECCSPSAFVLYYEYVPQPSSSTPVRLVTDARELAKCAGIIFPTLYEALFLSSSFPLLGGHESRQSCHQHHPLISRIGDPGRPCFSLSVSKF